MADDPTPGGWTLHQVAEPGGTAPGWAGSAPHAEAAGTTSDIAFRPLGVAEMLDGAISTIRRSPRASLGLALILTTALGVLLTFVEYYLLGPTSTGSITPRAVNKLVGAEFLAALLGLALRAYLIIVLSGLLAPVIGMTILGRTTSLRQAWAWVRPVVWRLLGCATVTMLAVALAAGLPIAPFIAAIEVGAPIGLSVIAGILGILVGLIAMVVCYVWFAIATPIVVLERRSVFAALGRSRRLVSGAWWRTLWTLSLALLITVVVGSLAIPLPFSIAQAAILSDHGTSGWGVAAALIVATVGGIVAGTLTNPFNAGVIALMYADRRMRREGFDIENADADPSPDLWSPGPLAAAGNGPQPKVPQAPARVFVAPMAYAPRGGYPPPRPGPAARATPMAPPPGAATGMAPVAPGTTATWQTPPTAGEGHRP